MADVQDNITEALSTAVENQRTHKLPMYNHTSKDNITARQLIERIEEIAASNAAWNDAKKILELKCSLQNEAKHIWETKLRIYTKHESAPLTEWKNYRNYFLNEFDPITTSSVVNIPFNEFRQKSVENSDQFLYRLDRHFRRLEESHPEELLLVNDARITWFGLNLEHVPAAARRRMRQWGEMIMAASYRRTEAVIYTAGLYDDQIRVKIQDEEKADDIHSASELAKRQEKILDKEKAKAANARAMINAVEDNNANEDAPPAIKPKMNSIDEKDVPSVDVLTSYEPADEAEWEWLNTMRSVRRMPPRPRPNFFKKSYNGNGNGNHNGNRGNGSDRRNMICRYKPCGKKGHGQAECFMRKRDNAPCVDAQGKPWKNQPRVNQMGNEEASLNGYRVM